MLESFSIMRPVGNRVVTKPCKTTLRVFSDYYSRFYQSGTASLASAIVAALQLKPNITHPEVIIPAYACPDLISAIVHAGAIPVLCDLEPHKPWMSLRDLENEITNNTIAIVAVRLLGIPEQNLNIKTIAHDHKILFIEDSAQGFPATRFENFWDGDFVILSFGRGKPVNLLGGGVTLTKDEELYKMLIKSHMKSASFLQYLKYVSKIHLYNNSISPLVYGTISKLPGLHIGQTLYKELVSIDGIDETNLDLLEANIAEYQKRSYPQPKWQKALNSLNKNSVINLPDLVRYDMEQPLLRYPILINNHYLRNQIHSKTKIFGTSLMYEKILPKIEKVNSFIKNPTGMFQNSRNFSEKLITLPNHNAITPKIINKVIAIINNEIENYEL